MGAPDLSPQRPATLVGRQAGLLPGASAPEAGLGRSRSWTGSVGRPVVLLRLGSSPSSTGLWSADPSRRTAPRRAGGATRRLGAGVSCFGLGFRWGNGLQAPGTLVMFRMFGCKQCPRAPLPCPGRAMKARPTGPAHRLGTLRAGPARRCGRGHRLDPKPRTDPVLRQDEVRDRPGGLRSRARKRVQEPHKWRLRPDTARTRDQMRAKG